MTIRWWAGILLGLWVVAGGSAQAGQCDGGDQHYLTVLVENKISNTFYGKFKGPDINKTFDIPEEDKSCSNCPLIAWCISNKCVESDHYYLTVYDDKGESSEIGSIRYHPKKEGHGECRLNAGTPSVEDDYADKYKLKDAAGETAHNRSLIIKKD